METPALNQNVRPARRELSARISRLLSPLLVTLAVLLAAIAPGAPAQSVLVSEGFEGVFPGSWSTGDTNAAASGVYWKDVNSSFGTVLPHTGGWKGYCAGIGFGGTISNPTYTNDMAAFMSRTISFAGFTGANLSFWYNIPSIETCCDHFRVYMDTNVLLDVHASTPGWVLASFPLNAYVGGSHQLRFEFDSDVSIFFEGAYLDDILVDAANQPLVSTLQSLVNANYTGFVLDSDTAGGRSNIQAQAVFSAENFTGTNTAYTNVLTCRLINASSGSPQPIYDLGNTATNSSYTYNITNTLSLAAGTNEFVTNTAFIRPAALMSQFSQYYLECRMFTNGVLAQTFTTAPATYYHFTNTVSGDAAWNVLLDLDGASWSQTYAINSVPGQNTFLVNAPIEIRRWDDFNVPIASTNIPIVFNYTLRDNSGNTVPLASNSQTFFDAVNSYSAGPNPTVIFTAHTLRIEPAGQLDSVNKTYFLTVTLSHTNNPATGQVLTANTQSTTTNELLHFDGNLFFGSIGTTMNSLSGTAPPANAPSGGTIPTTLGSAGSIGGYVTLKSDHTYASAGALNVSLNSSGDAFVTAGSVTLNGPTPDTDSLSRVRFLRGPVTLSSSGASANVTVTLPTGFGYRLNDLSSLVIQSTIPFTSVALSPSLAPASDLSFSAGGTIYCAGDNKPVWMAASKITWRVGLGEFDIPAVGPGSGIYVRASDYATLQSVSNLLVNPPAMGDKRSNDKYWMSLGAITQPPAVQADANSNAVLNTAFSFGPGSFHAHFPWDTFVQWTGNGAMVVSNDLVQSAGSLLTGAGTVSVPYSEDCPDCGSGSTDTNTPTITCSNSIFNFTTDGGLTAGGPTVGTVNLQWGFIISPASFAQEAFGFAEAGFHMPGVFVRGDQSLLPAVQGPTTILYTGFAVSNLSVIERPLSAGYSAGLADYAGLNFRCGTDSVHSAQSTIAGTSNINWQLTGRSKYYVRPAGVSGIHESVPGTFPTNLTLWGYSFTFTSYGLSYLSSQNKDSLVDGAISLPYPSQFIQGFNNMKFSCLGAPESGDIPQGDGFKVMAYWLADFVVHSLQFKSTNGCSPGAGFLVLGIEGYASHVNKALYGQVGFFPNGDQIPPSFGLGNISRLKLPNVINVDGPTNTSYTFTPVQDCYYNTYSNSPSGGVPGWISIFGKLDVPWFEDLQLHFQTSCHTNGAAASNAPIYLSGGWPRFGTTNSNYGWLDPSSNTPFETNLFDANNVGWPGSGGGLTIANYRNNQNAQQYHPRAQRLWLNLIQFDYPLSWDQNLRAFKSWQEVSNNLFVVTVQHQVKYMDDKHAEIDFGAQYDGLPKISIANLAFNAIDQATGVGDAIVKAAAQPVEDVLSSGLDEMDQLLDTQMKRMMDGVFDKTVGPLIDQLYTQLSNDFSSMTVTQRLQFVSDVNSNTLNFLVGNGSNPVANNLTAILQDLGDGTTAASNVIGQIQGYLRDASNAIASVIGVLDTTTNGDAIGSNVVGLVNKQLGERPVVPKLVQSLVGDIAPQFINAVVGPAVSNVLSDLDPALDQITDTLTDTQNAISLVSSNLGVVGDFTAEINNTLNTFKGELTNVSLQVSLAVTQYFGQFNYTIDNPFQNVSANDIKQFVRQQIEDQFFATTAAQQIQTELRQRLYDVDAAMKSQIDSVFQQINGALRDLISQALAQVDNSINKCLGDASDVIGAGKLSGHALIDGDSLQDLRIDGHFQFKVPDNMELDAFLEIKELNSDGTASSCYPSNAPFTEVTIGANGVPLDWASPGLKANLEAKFTFDGTTPFPVNLGGQLELVGELDFQAFQLHDLAAALAFGKYENYLALKGGVRFDGYDFSGAIFFGRTCTLDPLKLIDPDVAAVLGNPPFTGVYVYAQGWLPISEIVLDIPPSCLFDISAGVGAGAFYFAEGPTYGGKMFLGISGQLLCLVSIEGDVTMIGVVHGSGDLALSGKGHFEADLGPCPFCITLSKDVTITFIHNSFNIQ